MESTQPLPPARLLLPKPLASTAQTPHQFGTIPNVPSQRSRPQQHLAGNQGTPSTAAVKCSPSLPIPRSTLYYQRKRAQEQEQEPSRRKYERKSSFNTCKHCQLPKTKEYGHSRHVGQHGLDTFCPAVEGKLFDSKGAWLDARKKENPPKNNPK